eukprot:scaffold48791_cov59-Phaeocystis_antarctica.AAC.8
MASRLRRRLGFGVRAYALGLGLRQAAPSGESGRPRWLRSVYTATCDCGATSAIDDSSKLELRGPSSTQD